MAETEQRKLFDTEVLMKAVPPALLQTLFFAVPLVLTLVLTFQGTEYFRLKWTWDLATWTVLFSKVHHWTTMGHTIVMALITTVLCLLIAFPVAYALATRIKTYQNHVKILMIFSFLVDAVLKTFGWVLFLDQKGGLNWIMEQFGAGPEIQNILFTDWSTLLGMVYNLLAFMIFTIFLSIENIDRDLLRAAYDAGASKFRAFFEVTLPLCRPGIYAGCVLVYLLSLGVFLEPKVLGGGKNPMAAELIRQTFEVRINWPLGAGLTVVLMVAAIFSVLLFTRAYGLKRRGLSS